MCVLLPEGSNHAFPHCPSLYFGVLSSSPSCVLCQKVQTMPSYPLSFIILWSPFFPRLPSPSHRVFKPCLPTALSFIVLLGILSSPSFPSCVQTMPSYRIVLHYTSESFLSSPSFSHRKNLNLPLSLPHCPSYTLESSRVRAATGLIE